MSSAPASSRLPPGSGGPKPSRFWSLIPDAFSKDECRSLIAAFDALESSNGGLVAGRFDSKVRKSALVWLPDGDEFDWVNQRIVQLVAQANREKFNYTLDGFDEQVQLAGYGSGHYYDWHIDRGSGATAGRRKLTLSIQLTDPDLYVGGELELNATGRIWQAPRSQGLAVIFAAHTIHRVAPVLDGMRHSLVSWVHGPNFV